jgi:predicted glycosyltransferase involved in capsule biosynthesis
MALAAAVDFMENNPRKASVRLDVEFHGFPAEITEHPDFNDAADVLSNTVSSSLVIRRSAYLALGGFPIDECFRLHGGEDGALSLALTRTFGNHRLDDRRRVRMHYHAGIHAERYFRSRMGMPVASADPGTTQQTFVAADEAKRRILELRQLRVRSP